MRLFAGWLYFLGGIALIGAIVIYATNIPNVPDEDELVEFKGFLIAVQLQKDFDGTDVVFLKYRDHEQRFRYLSTYPMYVEIRDRLGIYREVDIMVEKAKLEDPSASPRIWGLVEHDPLHEGTVVTYDEIYEETTETDRSWQAVGLYMGLGGLIAVVLGWIIRRLIPYRPADPSV
jgi:hypothetical protein